MITVKVIEASSYKYHPKLITLQLRYPRFIHAEFMTHRVFSRNASSSRAVPVAKMLERIEADPAMPVHWGKNQPGMQAREGLDDIAAEGAKQVWLAAAQTAVNYARVLADMGVHKQIVNRITEPFQYIDVIVTATEWDNFFALRDHPDAQPEMQALARAMKDAVQGATYVERSADPTSADAWHLPYVSAEERAEYRNEPLVLARMSAARCARVSYMTHDGRTPSLDEDTKLYKRLAGASPAHASPLEHQAFPAPYLGPGPMTANFRGWVQHRKYVGL